MEPIGTVPVPRRADAGIQIDLDRGVVMRRHRKIGMEVYMYRDQPGVYMTAHGRPVSEKIAREAGFDTKALGAKKRVNDRIAQAAETIRAEETGAGRVSEEVVEERNGYQLVSIGLGRYRIKDTDGNIIAERDERGGYLTREIATFAFEELAGEGEEKEPEPKPKQQGDKDNGSETKEEGEPSLSRKSQ